MSELHYSTKWSQRLSLGRSWPDSILHCWTWSVSPTYHHNPLMPIRFVKTASYRWRNWQVVSHFAHLVLKQRADSQVLSTSLFASTRSGVIYVIVYCCSLSNRTQSRFFPHFKLHLLIFFRNVLSLQKKIGLKEYLQHFLLLPLEK